MLKLFYKTLLVSLISGSLLMLDMSYKGFMLNSAQAETLQTSNAESEGDLSSTLVMTSVGVLTSRLYGCKMTTDMMLAAAGGIAFLAGEVTSFFQEKEALEGIEMEIERNRTGAPTQHQIFVLEKLKKSYEEANKTAGTKKMLQQTAAAAFLAAAGVAVYLYSQETTAQTLCRTTTTTSTAACALACAACAGVVTCACPTCCAAAGPLGISTAERAAKDIAAMVNKPTAVALSTDQALTMTATAAESTATATCPAAGIAQLNCETSDLLEVTSRGVCLKPLVVNMQALGKALYASNNYTPIIPEKRVPNILETIFMQEARADLFSPMGIASSAAISFVLMTSATLGLQIDMFLFSPMNRALIWGVLSGLAFTAVAATSKQMEKISDNIQKIDKILNSMNSLEGGVHQHNNLGANNPKIDKTIVQNKNLAVNGSAAEDINLKSKGMALPCITGEDPNNCPSFSNKLNAQADWKSMPDSAKAQIGSISKLTDGLNGSSRISGSTLETAQSLAGQSNALKARLQREKQNLQALLKSQGRKTDVAKESAKLEANLKAAIQKELDSRKMSAGQMLASFGGGKGTSGGSSAVATDASKASSKSAKGKIGAVNVVAVPAAIPMNPKLNSDSDAELEAQLAAERKAAEDAAKGNQAASIDDYDLKNDITQDKDSSIFDLISNRYQKSGYPRLFKRIK